MASSPPGVAGAGAFSRGISNSYTDVGFISAPLPDGMRRVPALQGRGCQSQLASFSKTDSRYHVSPRPLVSVVPDQRPSSRAGSSRHRRPGVGRSWRSCLSGRGLPRNCFDRRGWEGDRPKSEDQPHAKGLPGNPSRVTVQMPGGQSFLARTFIERTSSEICRRRAMASAV
jgi:hypothetical protein